MKKIVLSLLIVTSVTATMPFLGFGQKANASEINSVKNVQTVTNETKQNSSLSQELIDKATPLVKTTENEFYLSDEGYSVLDSKEIEIVLNCIKNANETLNKNFETDDLAQKESSFVPLRATMMRAASGYMNIEYTWWGAQIYFSHKAVTDVNDLLVIGGTVGGITAFIEKAGIKLAGGYLSAIALAGTPLFWAMSKIDKGNGVYLNCILYVPATITAA